MENRPRGREKNVTGGSSGVNRRGSGLGQGPVGNPGNYSGRNPVRPTGPRPTGGKEDRTPNRGSGNKGGSGGLLKIILLLLVVLFGGGAGLGEFLGGETEPTATLPTISQNTSQVQQSEAKPYNPFDIFGGYQEIFSGGYGSQTSSGDGWLQGANTGKLNTSVSPEARNKRTMLLGDGKDTVTVMVYMCGTDLESRSGMATMDLQEMVGANLADNVNVILYTGGCRSWQNSVISSKVNQIYQVHSGGLACLKKDAGNGAMTSPETLASFIDFCGKNFPANRNILILWDHGGGSIGGYGYDEKRSTAGALTLSAMNQALSRAGVTFDFIGFDACLMATLENGLALSDYADYLIASEETEPGYGWYYTGWLNLLSQHSSISTLELGKRIVDDYITACARDSYGQKATLSVVDLAELEKCAPAALNAFSHSVTNQLSSNGYQTVAKARGEAREFSMSSRVDQIDLTHMALKLNTNEGRKLADVLLSAVKYNRTSSNMTNAYGLAVYFPYQKMDQVNKAIAEYKAIGLDSAYTECIRTFASMEASGQAAAGGTTSPMTALSGESYGSYSISGDDLMELLEMLLGSDGYSFFDRDMDVNAAARYIDANRFDPDALQWSRNKNGTVLHLSEDQWSLVQDLELNVFVDDGEGYIDLGLDNVFDFTDSGDLVGSYDNTWLAIDGQNVAYYHVDTTEDGNSYTITGRVPVLLNGTRAELILVFDNDNPKGYIAGARIDYRNGETQTIAKSMTALNPGDVIDYLCDYYTYDGTYSDSYLLGEQHVYTGNEQISNVYTNAASVASFRFTDIYNNSYWTPVIP